MVAVVPRKTATSATRPTRRTRTRDLNIAPPSLVERSIPSDASGVPILPRAATGQVALPALPSEPLPRPPRRPPRNQAPISRHAWMGHHPWLGATRRRPLLLVVRSRRLLLSGLQRPT